MKQLLQFNQLISKSVLENVTVYTEMKVSTMLAVHLTVLSISTIFKAQRLCLQKVFSPNFSQHCVFQINNGMLIKLKYQTFDSRAVC